MDSRLPTEHALESWRNGAVKAERLAAAILIVEGYGAVDPQSPLGGPDGLKDLLCSTGGKVFVGACYFASRAKRFREIREKFLHDLAGVSRNKADGIVFVTNQRLTPAQREELVGLARESSADAEIYHLERIRAVLDAPRGYGIRAEFLRIPMTLEEQLGFFADWRRNSDGVLRDQSRQFADLSRRLETWVAKLEELKETVFTVGSGVGETGSKEVAGATDRAAPTAWLAGRIYAVAEAVKDSACLLLEALGFLSKELSLERIFSVESKEGFVVMVRMLFAVPLRIGGHVSKDIAAKEHRVRQLLDEGMDLRTQLRANVYDPLNNPANVPAEVRRAIQLAARGTKRVIDNADTIRRLAESIMVDWGQEGVLTCA